MSSKRRFRAITALLCLSLGRIPKGPQPFVVTASFEHLHVVYIQSSCVLYRMQGLSVLTDAPLVDSHILCPLVALMGQ